MIQTIAVNTKIAKNALQYKYTYMLKSWRRNSQPTPVFLPGKSHGQRNLAGYNPWGLKELDTTERLTHTRVKKHLGKNVSFYFSTSKFLTLKNGRDFLGDPAVKESA